MTWNVPRWWPCWPSVVEDHWIRPPRGPFEGWCLLALLAGLLLVVVWLCFGRWCVVVWSFFFAGGSGCAGTTLKAKFILFKCDVTGDRCASSCRRNFLIDSENSYKAICFEANCFEANCFVGRCFEANYLCNLLILKKGWWVGKIEMNQSTALRRQALDCTSGDKRRSLIEKWRSQIVSAV